MIVSGALLRKLAQPSTLPANRVLLIICSLLLLLQPVLADDDQSSFVVIVNQDNPVNEIRVSVLSKIFMKRVVSWRDGRPAMPVDQLAESQVRRDFSNAVHGKPPARIVAYWHQQIFSGRIVPPPERGTDDEVIIYVLENADSVGYVSSQSDLGDRVKVIRVVAD